MKFICKTFFDITATGVTGHYKSSRVPFNDLSNVTIEDERSWNYARNQQKCKYFSYLFFFFFEIVVSSFIFTIAKETFNVDHYFTHAGIMIFTFLKCE